MSLKCNCPWEKDPEYECGRVAIIQAIPQTQTGKELSLYCEPTLYCKKCFIGAVEAGEWSPREAHVLPKKKLPRNVYGPFSHDWRKVNLVTRSDGTDLVRCRKCQKEVTCHGFYRPELQGCAIPDYERSNV